MLEHMREEFAPSCSAPILDESTGDRHIYYRLGESELFNYANKNTMVNGQALVDVIPKMVVTNNGFERVTLDQFDKTTIYELFESARYKISCRKAIRTLLETGKVILVYSSEYKVPTSIPYIVQSHNSTNATIFVNISDFVNIDAYGKYIVDNMRNYNALMSVIFAGCAAYRIVTSTSMLPSDLADGLVLMYGNMLTKVIQSLVHMDPVMLDKIRYLACEFALIQMYGTETGGKLFNRYKGVYFPKLSKMITDTIDDQFHVDNFDKLSLFVDELNRLYPSMRGLTVYKIYDKWIRNYGPATAMSIDYLGYHLYTICMVLLESPLISRMVLEPMLEKSNGVGMYRRLQMLIEG